jgi:cell wall-associated NlpC family hydrolase
LFRKRKPRHRQPDSRALAIAKHTPPMGLALAAMVPIANHDTGSLPVILPSAGPMPDDIFEAYQEIPHAHPRALPVTAKPTPTKAPKKPKKIRYIHVAPRVLPKHDIRTVHKVAKPKPVIHLAPAPKAVPQGSWATINAALRSALGTPYVYGGESPGGFDCSGLTQWAYAKVGIHLPRTAADQAHSGVSVSVPKPGDLIFWNSPATHVAVYIGPGLMIAAPHTGTTVKIESIYGSPYYRRVL